MEGKMRHLELVQGVINRMANNSFMLKGWAVTLVMGIFALTSKDTSRVFLLVAYIPTIVFWLLDAYYLLQERLYESLYDKVRMTNEKDIDFSLKATKKEFSSMKNSYFRCILSKTELCFYFPLAIACAVIIGVRHMC